MDKLAARLGLRVYRMSVKDDLNVGTVFQHLAEDYVTKVKYKIEFYKIQPNRKLSPEYCRPVGIGSLCYILQMCLWKTTLTFYKHLIE